nr:hypothetical protein [Nocardiopsis potens]
MPEPRTGPPRHRTTHLGWRHEVLIGDPGPPPRRPAPAERVEVSPEWVAVQRGTEARTNRPLVAAVWVLCGLALLAVALWPLRILPGLLALVAVLACLVVAVPVAVALLQSRRVVAERLAAERARLEAERRAAEGELRRRQEEHAREHTAWRARRRAFEAQPRWYGLKVPEDAAAVLVAGGTDAGWSAVLTTVGASRVASGGDVTVLDLSGRAVAGDLAALVRRAGIAPRIWVLPADLPRMNLGIGLEAAQRARTLAAVAAAFDPKADTEADVELIGAVLEVLGPDAGTGELLAGLRALALPEEEAGEEPPDPLTAEQRARIRERCGTGRERAERAWELEGHLAPFEGVGSRAEAEPYAQVKIIATDRAAGGVAARAYGTYTAAALCRLLEMRGAAADGRWGRTIMVCGADALSGADLDRLTAAAAAAGTGLVLFFPEAGDEVMARLERDDAFPVLMRQPAGRPAARLAEWLGGAPDLALHRLTEVIGEALDGTVADSYVEDVHPGMAATAPVAVRNAASSIPPLDLARHLRDATSWGRATAQAAQMDEGGAGAGARPHRIDARGLRTLPPTAMLVPGPDGPVAADANPGILTLPAATLATVEEGPPAPPPEPDTGGPAPNLGPPPERLDWRSEREPETH